MNTDPWPVFDNSYARLPARFYTRQAPVPVSEPGIIRINHELALQLGFDPQWLESPRGAEFIAGNFVPGGAQPLAQVYAGHQFGGWNPQLGDGRAVLIGEVIDRNGQRHDIQLKGAGRTPYSRGGDGRSPLGPVLREFIVSEAMAAMGVPTSRALAAATSGETVYREGPLPGAVLARVAKSHIRIGTIQYFASVDDHEGLSILLNHVLQRHYPQLADDEHPQGAMLDAIIARQADLVARWQAIGFIHGVMNTDNMLLSGETIDYGPCAFMDEFDAARVFSSIDHGGRYAYRNQPYIAHWNLSVLTQALLIFLHDDPDKAIAAGQAAIDAFPKVYQQQFEVRMLNKLGLDKSDPGSLELVQQWFSLMQETEADFTLSFRALSDRVDPDNADGGGTRHLYDLPDPFKPWLEQWHTIISDKSSSRSEQQAAMYAVNPIFIPRNHLVEAAIRDAETQGDLRAFHQLMEVLAQPFTFNPAYAEFALPPTPGQRVTETFCGT